MSDDPEIDTEAGEAVQDDAPDPEEMPGGTTGREPDRDDDAA